MHPILTANQELLDTCVALGPIVLVAGLVAVAVWGWATGGRGF